MLDNGVLKIADFGFATPLRGDSGDGKLYQKVGSRKFMSPEIQLGQSYSGEAADVFASGIILFQMISGSSPFREAT